MRGLPQVYLPRLRARTGVELGLKLEILGFRTRASPSTFVALGLELGAVDVPSSLLQVLRLVISR